MCAKIIIVGSTWLVVDNVMVTTRMVLFLLDHGVVYVYIQYIQYNTTYIMHGVQFHSVSQVDRTITQSLRARTHTGGVTKHT